jgi:hypothetical protein
MRHYNCRPPVIAYVKTPKVRLSADRKAHDALFFACKRLFDTMSEETRAKLIAANPEEMEKFSAAYETASDIAFGVTTSGNPRKETV